MRTILIATLTAAAFVSAAYSLATPVYAKDWLGCVLIAGKKDCPNRTQRNLANTDDAVLHDSTLPEPEPEEESEEGENEEENAG